MNIITAKRAYTCPKTIIISTGCDSLMQSASGNAGSIGFGGSGGDAKRGFYDEEEDETLHATFAHGVASVSNWEERTNE